MGAIAAAPISTTRLDLLPLRIEYAEEMAAVQADPDLYTFIGGSPPTVEALRPRYELMIAGSADPDVSWCNWVIRLRESGLLAGTVQATISTGEATVAEVAWVVGAPWQGQGIATEAASGMIDWLRQQSVQTVIAHIHPRHQASAAVAAAAGLTPTDESQDGETRWRLRMTTAAGHPAAPGR
jgi:RimJ/RimL family protein N-acetyltransferase